MVTQALAAEPKGQPRTLLLLLVHLVEYLLVPRAELSTLLIAAAGRDNTVKYRWRTLQLLPGMERPSYAGTVVEVLEGLDGQLAVRYQDRERSSPARRRRPVLAYSEASTALPHTGRSLGSTSTVWAGAGRLSWRHSTSTIPSTTALSQFERPPPRQAGSPLRFRRRGGTLCRRRSAGACRFEVSPANWPSIGTRRRNTCRLRVRQ